MLSFFLRPLRVFSDRILGKKVKIQRDKKVKIWRLKSEFTVYFSYNPHPNTPVQIGLAANWCSILMLMKWILLRRQLCYFFSQESGFNQLFHFQINHITMHHGISFSSLFLVFEPADVPCGSVSVLSPSKQRLSLEMLRLTQHAAAIWLMDYSIKGKLNRKRRSEHL